MEADGVDVREWVAEDFLEHIYGDREAWIDLPTKVGKYWVPFYSEWPADGRITRHIDAALRDGEDLYYSVAQFANRGRKIADVLPTSWLWADLDEVHPTTASELNLHPTVAVESSPGRYQALWRLTRTVAPKSLEKINRALTYALDADRGGYDLTQVLRIPGTRNFKYPESPMVTLMWYAEDMVYDPRAVWSKIKKLVPPEELSRAIDLTLPRRPIPARIKRLLRAPVSSVVEGERSNRLWEIECGLAEAGVPEEEIYALVWPSAWNKWKDVSSGKARLQKEIHKATAHVSRRAALKERALPAQQAVGAEDEEEEVVTTLPWVDHDTFIGMRIVRPRWAVDGIWSAQSQGIIAGEPKSSKSLITLALGVAVASGQPFLGQYRVKTQGPVLYIDSETGEHTTQDRLRRLEQWHGLMSEGDVVFNDSGTMDITFPEPSGIPFHILSNFAFDLTNDDHRRGVEEKISEIEPVMVIFDSLYLMLGDRNENQSHEIRPLLLWFTELKNQAGCSIPVVHHYKKQSESTRGVRAGQMMRGSGALHAWTECSLYCTAKKDEREGWSRTRVEMEHRAAAPRQGITLAWRMDEDDGFGMEWEVNVPQTVVQRRGNKIEEVVKEWKQISFKALQEATGMGPKAINRAIEENEHLESEMQGTVKVVKWQV